MNSTHSHNFHQSIIRAYDIRGIYNETLFDDDAYYLGRSFGYYLYQNNKAKVAVGYDGRSSSLDLKNNLIKGLNDSGIDVVEIGLGPTPMLYFSIYHLNLDAGIMVTGSHNPKNHNGFKISLKERPFYGDDIIKLSHIASQGKYLDNIEKGSKKKLHIKEDYIERLLQDCIIPQKNSELLDELDNFHPKKNLKIAWDSGNGSAGEIMKEISQRIYGEHFLLFDDIDGNFPNHHPDPTVAKNLQDLIAKVKEEGCDIGIAFDGDGDRIGIVDDEGEIIWGDQLLIFYSQEILQNYQNAAIIADVKASNIMFAEVKKMGGLAIMEKTGHSFIKAKLKETNAKLAGEMSGHIFFADKYYGFDDGIYAAIRILNILYQSKQTLSQMRRSLPQSFSTREIRIDCSDEIKFKVIDKLKFHLSEKKYEYSDIDGIRYETDIGWWLIRASNTQSCLVARCEAYSVANLEKLKQHLQEILSLVEIIINF